MRHTRLVSISLGAAAITVCSFAGCGVTPGRPITLSVSASLQAGPSFQTSAGWDVTLTEASLVIGPIYVLAPAARTAALDRLRAALLPTAFAHGGHDDYSALEVRAEWLDEATLEMGVGSQMLGLADGTAGVTEYSTVELVMPSSASGPTHGHVAWVHGTARPTAGGESIAFEGGLDLPDEPLARTVESIATPFEMSSNGLFELTVMAAPGTNPSGPSWLEEADFARLPVPTSGTVRQIAPGTQPYVAWMLAARDADSFRTQYQATAAQ
jgi:hypothetical protein